MITEDYVSFEIAKLLKEKGFDESTNSQYPVCGIHYGEVGEYNITDRTRNPEIYISAPTLQMVMKWLREVHNLHVFTIPVFEDVEYQPGEWQEEMTGYRYEIVNINPNLKIIKDYPEIRALTSESAYEAAIKYCLEKLV